MDLPHAEEEPEMEHVDDPLVPHYVTGKCRTTNADTFLALTPTDSGWKCRSLYSDASNHDYMSYESMDDLMVQWMPVDVKYRGMCVTTDREEALDTLATLLAKPAARDCRVSGPPCVPPKDAAEVVLRHLECRC